MRILHINSSLARRSGVMSVVMNYFRHIDPSRAVFDFFSYRPDPPDNYQEEIERRGGRCHAVNGGKNILAIRSALRRLLREEGGTYRIAHLHDPALARFLYPVLRANGVETVLVHSHATAYSDTRLGRLRNRLSCRGIERHADMRLACSAAAGEFLFGAGAFDVVPNAIDLDVFRFNPCARAEKRAELGLDGATVIGHVGRFNAQKNHHFLVSVFDELRRRQDSAILLLIGTGPLQDSVRSLVGQRGLEDRVRFLGQRNDTPELYQAMDLMLLPSLFEGLPMVGVEAQCSGLPMVCADTVSREIAIGRCVFLPLESPAHHWAQEIGRVLAAGGGPREEGAEQARRSGFDVSMEAERLLRRYESLVGR